MKRPSPPKLVTVAVTTTITIVFWIFITLYKVLTTEPEPSVNSKLLEPIIPELDSRSLQQINERVFFEEGSFVFNPGVVLQITPEAIPTPEPVVEVPVTDQ